MVEAVNAVLDTSVVTVGGGISQVPSLWPALWASVAQHARRPEMRAEARMHVADLEELLIRRAPDLLLRVEAEAHRELVV